MRLSVLFLLLLLVSCASLDKVLEPAPGQESYPTQEERIEEPEPEVVAEDLAVDEVAIEEQEELFADEQPAPPKVPELSLTEQYEQDFLALDRPYFYQLDVKGYGIMYFFDLGTKKKYTSPDHLFEVDEDGKIFASKWAIEASDDSFYDLIKERKLNVMDYLGYENGSYYGCYVRSGYYKRENCIKDNESVQIVFDGIDFDEPESPLDWLRKYHGKEPSLIRAGYTDKEDNLVRIVDQVYFENPDGTTTELIVHAKYHIPVKVIILGKDKKVKETIEFKYLVTDLHYIRTYAPYFLDS